MGPNHRSMYSLNFLYDASDLIFSGSAFQIFRPSVIKLLSLQVAELAKFSFDVNMFLIKLGLSLSTVLKISVAKNSILRITLRQRLWIFSIFAVDLQELKCHTSGQ